MIAALRLKSAHSLYRLGPASQSAAQLKAHADDLHSGPEQRGQAAQATDAENYAATRALTRRVYYLGVCFWVLFQAYSAAQLLQAAVNGSSGYACLATLYALFAIASTCAPWIMAKLDARSLLPVSSLPYIVMVGVNMNPVLPALVPACAAVGIGAATLWAAQGVYVGSCATEYAAITGDALTDVTSRMNSAFYGVFASAGGFSSITASLVITYGSGNAIGVLFLYLTIVAIVAAGMLTILAPPQERSARVIAVPLCCTRTVPATPLSADMDAVTAPAPVAAIKPPPPSPIRMLTFLVTDPRMRCVLPLMLVVGMGYGSFNGVWMAALVAGKIGVGNVGYIGALYSFVSSAATFAIGRLIRRSSFGRRGAFTLAGSLHMAFYVAFAAWAAAFPGNVAFTHGLLVAILGSAAFSIGDSVWFSQIPATLQTFFPAGPDLACAMASIRCCTAVGFAVQSVLSVGLTSHVWAQFVVLAASLAAALLLLAYLDRNVCSLDGSMRRSGVDTQTAADSSGTHVRTDNGTLAPTLDSSTSTVGNTADVDGVDADDVHAVVVVDLAARSDDGGTLTWK